MKKIGIFGGSFNPVHTEHINMVKAFITELDLDKVIIVPARQAPHKKNEEIAPAEDRINMLKLAFSDCPKAEISSFEAESAQVSYTYKTIEHFKSLYMGSVIYFLLGTDMLADFCTWKNPNEITELASLALITRTGDDEEKAEKLYYDNFSKPFVKLDYVGKNLSSTEIRAAVALGLDCKGITPAVREYIELRRLYSNQISEFVKKNLPIKRLLHTFGVIKLAVSYAKRLKINATDAYYAAMLHDCAKYLDYRNFGMDMPAGVPKAVEHQFLGAYIAENVLKVRNTDIINAIKYHTTGRSAMSRLEQIIFLADLLEEGRAFDGADELRDAVSKDFDYGFKRAIIELYAYLSKSGGDVYYLTAECYDYYAK